MVDDGSTDDTSKMLSRFESNPRVSIFTLPHNVGVPGARNAGVAHSRSDIVVFLDADAIAPSDWLLNLLAPFADSTVAGTGGPDRAPEGDNPFALAVDYSMQSWIASGRLRLNNPFAPFVPAGCNFAIRRNVFNDLGGFEVRLNRRGEEKELIQRMRRRGLGIAYCDRALIWHHRRVSPKQFWRQNFLSGRARIDILRLAPDAFAWPHLVPAMLVIALLSSGVQFVVSGSEGPGSIVLGVYILLLLIDYLIAATANPFRQALSWVPLTTATIHWGYGTGLIVGSLRWLMGYPVGSGCAPTESIVDAPPK